MKKEETPEVTEKVDLDETFPKDKLQKAREKANKEKEKPKEAPKPEPTAFNVKTMIDGDYRLPAKLRERIGFNKHVDLTISIVGKIQKGKTVTLKFERANLT